jgi:hypothetical protein
VAQRVLYHVTENVMNRWQNTHTTKWQDMWWTGWQETCDVFGKVKQFINLTALQGNERDAF